MSKLARQLSLLLALGLLCGLSVPRTPADSPAPASGFTFTSGVPAYDTAYQKARGVLAADTKNGSFMAGTSWNEVWTRDTSYSVDLAAALLSPQVSKDTLLAQRQPVAGIGECWFQDVCGHFGGWPNLTDSIVGATGAWSLYTVTGDTSLLRPCYDRTARTLQRAERDAFSPALGLYGGCASFMESDSAYPPEYANNGAAIAKTYALSTNLLYYHAFVVTARMAALLGERPQPFQAKADALKAAINARFWMPAKGYYGYFLNASGKIEDRMEGTGEAFAILYGVADPARAKRLLHDTPTTPRGYPCLWPQYPKWTAYNTGDALYYHNGMIWPFVEGYWAWAAAREGDVATFGRELDALTVLSQQNDTFMEFYHPEDGKPDGSSRQLWSAAGYLSMIYHGLFGMEFDPQGIRFAPVVPAPFHRLSLTDVRYRHCLLNITVTGQGNQVRRFLLDGKPQKKAFFDAARTGSHAIEIQLGHRPGLVQNSQRLGGLAREVGRAALHGNAARVVHFLQDAEERRQVLRVLGIRDAPIFGPGDMDVRQPRPRRPRLLKRLPFQVDVI